MIFEIRRTDRNRVEQAKTHRAIERRMMARRAHQCKAARAFFRRYAIEQPQKTARCQDAHRERVAGSNRVSVQGIVIDRRSRLHQPDMRRFMYAFNLGASRRSRCEKIELFPLERVGQIEQDLDPLRSFGM
jgi:hypothetical protein